MINIRAIAGLLVASTPAASLPVPSAATDGISISNWNVGSVEPVVYDAATVYIAADGAATLTNPVKLWGYRNGQWWLLGNLNASADVPIAASTGGFAQRVDEVGIFSRLAVSCSAVTGGRNYTYSFEPIAIRND